MSNEYRSFRRAVSKKDGRDAFKKMTSKECTHFRNEYWPTVGDEKPLLKAQFILILINGGGGANSKQDAKNKFASARSARIFATSPQSGTRSHSSKRSSC